uniref:Uncharacterized protein n=1 Tax=uncultured marine group II/III euryarchaeote KM3_44_G05 TaxID=1456448 RepID=A0A075H4S9_9EURY|nr:hypothetical protein [uncultured marine group II/III euryarchaeote KM3_44_G05]
MVSKDVRRGHSDSQIRVRVTPQRVIRVGSTVCPARLAATEFGCPKFGVESPLCVVSDENFEGAIRICINYHRCRHHLIGRPEVSLPRLLTRASIHNAEEGMYRASRVPF